MTEKDWQVAGTMAQAERRAILQALNACDFGVSSAARRLRIARSTIYRLIKLYEIDLVTPIGVGNLPPSEDSSVSKPESRVVLRNGFYFIEHPDAPTKLRGCG